MADADIFDWYSHIYFCAPIYCRQQRRVNGEIYQRCKSIDYSR